MRDTFWFNLTYPHLIVFHLTRQLATPLRPLTTQQPALPYPPNSNALLQHSLACLNAQRKALEQQEMLYAAAVRLVSNAQPHAETNGYPPCPPYPPYPPVGYRPDRPPIVVHHTEPQLPWWLVIVVILLTLSRLYTATRWFEVSTFPHFLFLL